MHEIKELDKLVETIENEENYYACFPYVVRYWSEADTVRRALWNAGVITDEESGNYKDRIIMARQTAIDTHKAWLINMFKDRDLSKHTLDSFISTIYHDIFN